MYEVFLSLLKERNMKAADVCRGTGLPSSLFSEWKKGKSNPKTDKLQKIADFFGVSIEYLMTGKETTSEKETATHRQKSRDIRQILADAEIQLKQEGLLFDGKLADSNTINAILSAMEMGAAMAEKKSKEQEIAKTHKFVEKEQILNAAHARTDIEIPDDIDTSDDDIMNDENF